MGSIFRSFGFALFVLSACALSQVPNGTSLSDVDMDDPDQALTQASMPEGPSGEMDPPGNAPSDTLLMHSIIHSDSVRRHFYYVVPEAYDPGIFHPLFVWLHGGVSTEELRTMDPQDIDEWVLIPRLLEEGYLVVFPCGQRNAAWWDPVGEEGILRIIRWMKSNFRIDDSRVFVGGFSDGASGSFSLMMLRPGAFAGYIALSGHPGVAAIAGERGTYLPSLTNRPGIAVHTDQDGLYPARHMAGTIDLAVSAGADILYRVFEGYGHDPSFVPQMEDEIIEWLDSTGRVRFPRSITWETAEPSGCDWLMVDSVVSWPLLAEDGDFNMVMVSERLQFGFYPDRDYEGNGIRVSGIVDGDYPAARAGFQEGDVIVGFQGSAVAGLDDLGRLQEGMSPGDSFTVDVQRGSAAVELEDRFNPPEYYWLFPRHSPSVRIRAARSDNHFDLEVNRLCLLRLLLHEEMVDFDREITVSCNGHEIFRGTVETDEEYMLQNLLREMDAERMYRAELVLDLEDLLPPLIHDGSMKW